MTIALDVGTGRMKSLRYQAARLVSRSAASVYAVAPDTDAHRRALLQLRIPHAVCEGKLVLLSDAALQYASLFQVTYTPLMPGGRLPQDDPPSRQIVAALVEMLLPPPKHTGDACCLALPGEAADERQRTPEFELLTRIVSLRGYQPLVMNGATAIVLAEGADRSLTGIGISFGAGTSELSLVHRGRELGRCSIPRGGFWIDEQLAAEDEIYLWDADGHRYLHTAPVTAWKESYTGSILEPSSLREVQFARRVHELVAELLSTSAETLSEFPGVEHLPRPLTVFCAGGTAQITGFATLVQQSLAESPLPVPTDEVRIAADPIYTVARGCLIAAELEADVPSNSANAA